MVSHNFHKTWFILLISFILLVVFIVTYPACFANTEKNIEFIQCFISRTAKWKEVEILKLSDAFKSQEVDYCIDADHLRSFLIRNRAEVEPMLLSEGTVEEYVDSMNEVKEQEIERLKKVVQEKDEELSKVTQEKDEKNNEIARLKALLAAKENN